MPSHSCRLLAQAVIVAIERKLNEDEMVMVEELVYNYFPQPLVSYVVREHERFGKREFLQLYLAMKNGIIRGAKRTSANIPIQGRFKEVYLLVDRAFKHNFPDREVDAIRRISEALTKSEFEWGMKEALNRGVESAAYVLKAALSRRERAMARPAQTKNILMRELPVCKIKDVGQAKKDWADKREGALIVEANKQRINRLDKPSKKHSGIN